jgi:hypothetical protein
MAATPVPDRISWVRDTCSKPASRNLETVIANSDDPVESSPEPLAQIVAGLVPVSAWNLGGSRLIGHLVS